MVTPIAIITQPPLASKAMAASSSTQPFTLSSFQLLKTIGTGTFGRVYLSSHRQSGTHYAMKVLKKAAIVRLKQVEHVISEAKILGMIHERTGGGHPFIVNLLARFQDDRCLFMLEEYVQGGELFTHLRRAGRFSNDVARFYSAEILCAIEYLHGMGVIYRDLKPENLLIDVEGHVKIADFGFAKIVEDRTWTLCGTPEYLAPEIIQSKGHGKPVDHWALGILTFEMLHGYPPFYSDTPFGIYEKILAGKVVFIPAINSDAKDFIRRLLVADRSKRLGNLKGGIEDVKNHRWFRGVDWKILLRRDIQPPIIPKVGGGNCTINFENYAELSAAEVREYECEENFEGLFRDF